MCTLCEINELTANIDREFSEQVRRDIADQLDALFAEEEAE